MEYRRCSCGRAFAELKEFCGFEYTMAASF